MLALDASMFFMSLGVNACFHALFHVHVRRFEKVLWFPEMVTHLILLIEGY